MARLFVAIGGLIVLALTAALVAPYFVDWTSYRADFEREAGRILGREVTVRGEATARLLPFPSVSFTDVAVAGVEPGETAMTVETFSMDAELAPFMRGDIHIFDMRLVRPQVFVDLADDGALDWAVRPSVPVEASHISLEKLTVTEGKVDLRHAASGRIHRLTEINADISARALTGPWRMDGSLRLDGMRMALQASTGQADGQGGMRLRLQARSERYALALESDGSARIEDGRARYSGTFRLNAPVAAEPATAGGGNREPPSYRLSGAFDLDHAALAVEEFRFETGPVQDPYVAEGTASFDLGPAPRFLIRADGAQIRFDDAAGEAAGRFDLRQRLAALHEFLLDAPRPTIPGRIEMMLPAVVAGDTTARDVHLFAEPSEAGWNIASLGGTLPGRTTLEAKGALAVGDEAFGFDGSLLLAVGQPSGFAAWLARDVDDAIRRLPAAGFSADVALSPERQTFRNLELVLGDAKFRGEAESRTPAGAKHALALKLDGDRLDVEGMAAFASLFVSDSGEARLAERDLELEIVAGPVSAAGLTAETLDTALRLKEGRLEIDRLAIGGLAGANVGATATLTRLSGPPTGEIDASIIAADLAPLVAALAGRFPENPVLAEAQRRAAAYPGLLEEATVRIEARSADGESSEGGLILDVSGEAGGTAFTLDATVQDPAAPLAAAPVTLSLTAGNDDVAPLYALLGLPALPLGLAGPAEASLAFDGVAETGGSARFTFVGEGLDIAFVGEASLTGERLAASGEALVESDDLEPWLVTAGVALPGFGLGLPVSLQSRLDYESGLLVLSDLRGEVVGVAASGDVNAQLRDGLPHLTGALVLGSFDLAPIAELAAGAQAFAAPGDGSWPDAAFSSSAAMPFTAELDLSAEQLQFGSFAGAQDARMMLKLGRDGVSVSDMRASMFGGGVSGLAEFRKDAGTGLLSAQLRLDGADVAALLGDVGLAGAADLTASVTASGKSVDGLVTALSGSGTAAMRDIAISGVAPDVFPDLIARADEVGAGIDAAAVAAFAPPLVRAGTFGAAGVDIAFTVANGAVRAPPFRLETQGAALAGEVGADLSGRSVGADVTLTFDPGHEALAGSEPAVRFVASGPLDAIRVAVDTEPLAQFLTQRALELEQQRVEAMQAALIEKQRLRRETRYYASLVAGREAAAEEARRAAEEAERIEQERLQREEEERRRQEEEAERRRIEDEARRMEEETRLRQAAEEAARLETERRQAEDERLRAEVEALLRAREAAPAADAPVVPADRPADAAGPEPGSAAPASAPPTPNVIEITPMPAPRNAPAAAARPIEPPPPLPDPQRPPTPEASGGLSIDGLMRAIGIAR
ncbi:MAG: AsmA protein [Aquamicrobium sp.]|uniref:AsmA-like C-terminal region-containing protein n=1 Tax=Aquamicrobium sp. TaxID=1872579 RepID=UPI00349EE045|nr:AsmA protein [Aquamicrobium sp.]